MRIICFVGELGDMDSGVLEEQKRIESQLQQERRDQELARLLQQEMDKEARCVQCYDLIRLEKWIAKTPPDTGAENWGTGTGNFFLFLLKTLLHSAFCRRKLLCCYGK